MSSLTLTTSEFLSCTPPPVATATATVTDLYTVTYCATLLAACPASTWLATYYITEVCTGQSSTWTTPSTLNDFVQTTVICDVCAEKTQVVTCPVASPTGNVNITGNGITAGAGITPTGAPLPMPGSATTGASLPVVTAGAPSLKRGLLWATRAMLFAGPVLLLA